MDGSGHVVQQIALAKLHAHPRNANAMSAPVFGKLKRHLERSGRYEPLVVRPHPGLAGEYQLINGHHRAQALRELGRTEAACLVWELDDEQTLVLLATVNRLCGKDRAGKRLELLQEIMGLMKEGGADLSGLAKLLPEDERTLERLMEAPAPVLAAAPLPGEMLEALTIFMRAKDKAYVLAALRRTDADLAAALLRWARGSETGKGEG